MNLVAAIPPFLRRAAHPLAPHRHPELGISQRGVVFIARWEGFRAQLYNDAAVPPNATIGYGHVVHPGPITGHEKLTHVTQEEALRLLSQDCSLAELAVRRLIAVHLTQPQFDALVSFTYNCGSGALEQSQLRRDLNAGRYDTVPANLMHWVHAGRDVLPGLVNRRRAEGELFAHGIYLA